MSRFPVWFYTQGNTWRSSFGKPTIQYFEFEPLRPFDEPLFPPISFRRIVYSNITLNDDPDRDYYCQHSYCVCPRANWNRWIFPGEGGPRRLVLWGTNSTNGCIVGGSVNVRPGHEGLKALVPEPSSEVAQGDAGQSGEDEEGETAQSAENAEGGAGQSGTASPSNRGESDRSENRRPEMQCVKVTPSRVFRVRPSHYAQEVDPNQNLYDFEYGYFEEEREYPETIPEEDEDEEEDENADEANADPLKLD